MVRSPGRFVALLRGINVGGKHRIAMMELRAACEQIGWRDVRTYIQSGNVVFSAGSTERRAAAALEQAIERRFDLSIPVVACSAATWRTHVAGNPFLEAASQTPSLVMLALPTTTPRIDAAERLRERAADGERIEQVGHALWIHFPAGAGRSRLSPAALDRAAGSPVTMRNWRTVLALQALLSPES